MKRDWNGWEFLCILFSTPLYTGLVTSFYEDKASLVDFADLTPDKH